MLSITFSSVDGKRRRMKENKKKNPKSSPEKCSTWNCLYLKNCIGEREVCWMLHGARQTGDNISPGHDFCWYCHQTQTQKFSHSFMFTIDSFITFFWHIHIQLQDSLYTLFFSFFSVNWFYCDVWKLIVAKIQAYLNAYLLYFIYSMSLSFFCEMSFTQHSTIRKEFHINKISR